MTDQQPELPPGVIYVTVKDGNPQCAWSMDRFKSANESAIFNNAELHVYVRKELYDNQKRRADEP